MGENVGNKVDLGLIEGASVEATNDEKRGNMSGTYNALFKKKSEQRIDKSRSCWDDLLNHPSLMANIMVSLNLPE